MGGILLKTLEIKSVDVKSTAKAAAYICAIQVAIFVFLSLMVTIVRANTGLEQVNIVIAGISYLIICAMFLVISIGISVLTAIVYNFFTKKYGGLQISVEEIDKNLSINTDSLDNKKDFYEQE